MDPLESRTGRRRDGIPLWRVGCASWRGQRVCTGWLLVACTVHNAVPLLVCTCSSQFVGGTGELPGLDPCFWHARDCPMWALVKRLWLCFARIEIWNWSAALSHSSQAHGPRAAHEVWCSFFLPFFTHHLISTKASLPCQTSLQYNACTAYHIGLSSSTTTWRSIEP